MNVTAKNLIKLGYESGPWIPLVLEALEKNELKYSSQEQRLMIAKDVLENPSSYKDVPYWSKVIEKLHPSKEKNDLLKKSVPFEVYGKDIIEIGALDQMYQAAKLPISIKGALMPDSHQGYGLPIGGVLATDNAVIPYGVGVDIGCRMALTLYPYRDINENHSELFSAIEKNSFFGSGIERPKFIDHEVLYNPLFKEIDIIKSLKDKAAKQLGTSGSGNHFVEFGEVEFTEDTIVNGIIVPKGKYLGLLTHSGSRGLGANIAKYYTDKAKKARKLDPTVSNLAWFYLNEELGIEYWNAMNLAGDYAKACHDIIHQSISKQLFEKPIIKIENHHNFAWKEIHDGRELIVHRKGATPAGEGVFGIIPGSMSTKGFIVMGKGNPNSLNSASHGAGRTMSRSQAKKIIDRKDWKQDLNNAGITLMGAGLDESSRAYKDINVVMSYQSELVDIVASFNPKIVRMAGDNEEPED